MLGTRGIWEKGWKAVTVHGPTSGHRQLRQGRVAALPHRRRPVRGARPRRRSSPRSSSSSSTPGSRRRTSTTSSRSTTGFPSEIINDPRPQPEPTATHLRLLPGHGRRPRVGVGQRRAAGRSGSSPTSTIDDARGEGVIFAHGSRFGGHALFLKDQKLWYVYNFLGIPPEQQFVSEQARARQVRPGHGVHQGVDGRVPRGASARRSCTSTTQVVATGPMRTQIAQFTLCGDGLCVGRDSGDAVSAEYTAPFRFTGGTHPPGRGQRRRRPVRRPREGRRRDARPRVAEAGPGRQARPSPPGGRRASPMPSDPQEGRRSCPTTFSAAACRSPTWRTRARSPTTRPRRTRTFPPIEPVCSRRTARRTCWSS